jgi:membrane protease YdiL (CAAX protease family)
LTAELRARCATCGVPNTLEARYCRGCGTLFVATMDPPAASSSDRPVVPVEDHAWREVRGVAWLFVGTLGVFALEWIGGGLGLSALAVDVALSVVAMVTALGLTIAGWPDVKPALATAGDARAYLETFIAFVALLAFGAIYFSLARRLGFQMLALTRPYVRAGWPAWSMYASLALEPAVAEELIFRGYVMSRLRRALSDREVLIVQAALFSLVHFAVGSFPSHFLIGMTLGLLRRRSGSLYPGMLLHFAWNAHAVWGEMG